jgi:transcriptional regulator with XRE-family HTH domain
MAVNGEAIRRLRHRNRESLRELGKRAELGASYLCEMENGRKPGNEEIAERLARALCVPLAEIYEPDGDPPVFIEPSVLDKLDGRQVVYSPEQASELVGGVVKPGWLVRKALRGEIESSLIGGKTCFTPENIRALIRPRVVEAA